MKQSEGVSYILISFSVIMYYWLSFVYPSIYSFPLPEVPNKETGKELTTNDDKEQGKRRSLI